ncbi:choline-binding protein [Lacticaseibacillus pabuli]|uniref:Choline-binding protein n=1 Tax=Lacticaseibacillus pabuli TaxID=3025672 RepID=A0ABY7WS08_9LACO|nr:choline-binding protein [Lacticaseibacillus sp. KACC 23028]WDF82947.1 choline-binding protein [Lacticaseibacillus sp. KACC 23028]
MKKVKNRSLISLFSIAVAVLSIGSSTVLASSWSISKVYVPAHGKGSGVNGSGNTKATNGGEASFNGDSQPNWLGCKSQLVNTSNIRRSDDASLYKNKTTHAATMAQRGYTYYANVHSAGLEPNGSWVKLHFSADKK